MHSESDLHLWTRLTEPAHQAALLRMLTALRQTKLTQQAFMEAAAFTRALYPELDDTELTDRLIDGGWIGEYAPLIDRADDASSRNYRTRTLADYRAWHRAVTALGPETSVPDSYARYGIIVVPRYSSCYPPLLNRSPDHPPAFLFVSGSGYLSAIRQPQSLAVVGSRKMTEYGRRFMETQFPVLFRHRMTVVSGMARGVDALAHRQALASERPTLAVLGHGLDMCYPREHSGLMTEIRAGGAVVSEYPPGTPLVKQAFAARNRLIASLCHATLVVEADARSGALITANKATNAHREVLALPGSVFAPMSRGCLDLISQGATPIRHSGDILNALLGFAPSGAEEDATESPASVARLDPEYVALLTLLRSEPLTTDQAVARLDRPLLAMMKLLSECELMGLITQDQGRFFLTSYGYSCI